MKLKINWILAGASLSGGVKANRELAEAMVRRGHDITISYPVARQPWPKLVHFRCFLKRLIREVSIFKNKSHHLKSSTAKLLPINSLRIEADDVNDADFVIASWWKVRENLQHWPVEKGKVIHLIRGYELHGGDPDRVAEVYRLPGTKFAVSHWLKGVMASSYNDQNVVVIPDAIDHKIFNAPKRDKSPIPTVGMMIGKERLKGAHTVFEAIRILQKRFNNLRVIAFGANSIEEKLLPSNLEFHLRPDQLLIPKLYRDCDCWIVPSITEGFGLPGLEAASCRCPVVSTKCGGPADYIDDGRSGYLVPIEDPKEMAEAISRVLLLDSYQWRQMSDSSYEIAQRFDWDISAERLENELVKLLGS